MGHSQADLGGKKALSLEATNYRYFQEKEKHTSLPEELAAFAPEPSKTTPGRAQRRLILVTKLPALLRTNHRFASHSYRGAPGNRAGRSGRAQGPQISGRSFTPTASRPAPQTKARSEPRGRAPCRCQLVPAGTAPSTALQQPWRSPANPSPLPLAPRRRARWSSLARADLPVPLPSAPCTLCPKASPSPSPLARGICLPPHNTLWAAPYALRPQSCFSPSQHPPRTNYSQNTLPSPPQPFPQAPAAPELPSL